jgi:hypothetical protein
VKKTPIRARVIVVAAAVMLLLPGTWPAAAAPGAPLSTLTVDWPVYLALEAQSGEVRGRTMVYGTIKNISGFGLKRIQLLIDGLDANGAIVNQRVEWLGPTLAPDTHAYFEMPVGGPAARYRVTVFAFDVFRRG